jgi:hypothetical protein
LQPILVTSLADQMGAINKRPFHSIQRPSDVCSSLFGTALSVPPYFVGGILRKPS